MYEYRHRHRHRHRHTDTHILKIKKITDHRCMLLRVLRLLLALFQEVGTYAASISSAASALLLLAIVLIADTGSAMYVYCAVT